MKQQIFSLILLLFSLSSCYRSTNFDFSEVAKPAPTQPTNTPFVTIEAKDNPNVEVINKLADTLKVGSDSSFTKFKAPIDPFIAVATWLKYGSSYTELAKEIKGGSTKFWFYGDRNDKIPPMGYRNGNGYETTLWSTHSINWVNDSTISKCRYQIKNSKGEIVLFVEDTKSGFHPNFGANKRSNNHPDDTNRYLPIGEYTLEYENISDVPLNQIVSFRLQGSTKIINQIYEAVPTGKKIIRKISVYNTWDDPDEVFKFNNNYQN